MVAYRIVLYMVRNNARMANKLSQDKNKMLYIHVYTVIVISTGVVEHL